MHRVLLAAGVAIPFVYFANLFGVGAITPLFDHGSLLPSELGREGMPHALLFNAGLIAVGVLGLLASAGLFLGLRAIGGNLMSALTALSFVCFGIAMIMAGVFALPNPLHYGFNIILAVLFTPLLGALAFKGGGAARWSVFAGFLAGFGALTVNAGVGGIATRENFGWVARVHGFIAFSTIAFLCYALLRAQPRRQT